MSSVNRDLDDPVESDLVDIGLLPLREIVAEGDSVLDHSVRRILAEMRDPSQEPTAGHSNATS
jgi:FXSXX-COOH protein